MPQIFVRYTLIILFAVMPFSWAQSEKIPPQVAVSPSRFILKIDEKPVTRSFRVINLGKDPLEILVTIQNWEMDENNQVKAAPPTEQSLDQWLVVNPLHFQIKPGESQTVRFSIRPRVRPEAGEHRAMIYLNQQLPEAKKSSSLRFRFQYGITVYGHAEKIEERAVLNQVAMIEGMNPPRFGFDITNQGNVHVRMAGEASIRPTANDSTPETAPAPDQAGNNGAGEFPWTGRLPTHPVLPGDRRDIVMEIPLKMSPGAYLLDIKGQLAGETINREIRFVVKAGRDDK